MDTITQSELVLNLILSAALFGLIWIVQIVHYPSFKYVSDAEFPVFHKFHTSNIFWIVMPLMLAEIALGAWLLVRSGFNSDWFFPFMLVLVNWLSTFFIQIPIHNQLDEGKDEQLINRLIGSNWIRTISWSLKLSFVAWVTYYGLS